METGMGAGFVFGIVFAYGHWLVFLAVMVIGGLGGVLCWCAFSGKGQKMAAAQAAKSSLSTKPATANAPAITEEMVKQKLAQIDLDLSSPSAPSSDTQTRHT